MKSTEETRELAQGVLDYIHKYPDDHKQNFFFRDMPSSDTTGSCGTNMCIAGTATWLTHGVQAYFKYSPEVEGAKLLGLNAEERNVLFFEMDNDRAVDKLKKIVVGEEFSIEDFATHNGMLMVFNVTRAQNYGFSTEEIDAFVKANDLRVDF